MCIRNKDCVSRWWLNPSQGGQAGGSKAIIQAAVPQLGYLGLAVACGLGTCSFVKVMIFSPVLELGC